MYIIVYIIHILYAELETDSVDPTPLYVGTLQQGGMGDMPPPL